MITEKRATKLVFECLDELYKNSNPSITWIWVKFFYGDTDIKFWENHKISDKKYNEIVQKYKKKLGDRYSRSLNWDLLNYAPMVIYDDKKN